MFYNLKDEDFIKKEFAIIIAGDSAPIQNGSCYYLRVPKGIPERLCANHGIDLGKNRNERDYDAVGKFVKEKDGRVSLIFSFFKPRNNNKEERDEGRAKF